MKPATTKATIPMKITLEEMAAEGYPDLHFKCKVNRILQAKLLG